MTMKIKEMKDRGIVCIDFGDGEIITLTDKGYELLSHRIIREFLESKKPVRTYASLRDNQAIESHIDAWINELEGEEE